VSVIEEGGSMIGGVLGALDESAEKPRGKTVTNASAHAENFMLFDID
jgi:hypothetical protein